MAGRGRSARRRGNRRSSPHDRLLLPAGNARHGAGWPRRSGRARNRRRDGSGGVTTDHFAGDVAARYDETAADMFEPDVVGPTIDFLADVAGGGAALELGIGTGRIALPFAGRGVRVCGIDLSPDM